MSNESQRNVLFINNKICILKYIVFLLIYSKKCKTYQCCALSIVSITSN